MTTVRQPIEFGDLSDGLMRQAQTFGSCSAAAAARGRLHPAAKGRRDAGLLSSMRLVP